MNTAFMRSLTSRSAAIGCALSAAAAFAATCPFDTGGSDAINDGVVLTRYALGITGSPMIASTRYASLDPLQVKANIECVGCALDMNGDNQIDAVDATIIARHLAGFSGASLTGGLALGAGSRNTTAAVTSFLANGCAVGGAINAFVQGGNAFGAPAVLGTTDAQPLTVQSGGTDVKLVNLRGDGLRVSFASSSPNTINGNANNIVAAIAVGATIGGGGAGTGNSNVVNDSYGTVAGGYGNIAGLYAVVSGGGLNAATGTYSTLAGGVENVASGFGSTVASGRLNVASGVYSFAAGHRAKAVHDYSFVWGATPDFDTTSSAAHQFRVYAPESIRMYASTVPGAGCILSTPSSGWACSSDRDMKTNIHLLDTVDVLKRVIAMPLSSWSFKGAETYTHIGPMAQDFSKAFALGADDKTISAMDSAGVALAAIQGLHLLVKDKDTKLIALEKANAAMQRDVALMKKRLRM